MEYTLSTPIDTIGSHSVTPVCPPQPLSKRLQAVWKIIADLAVKEGHAFADTPWWAWRLGCTPQHVNRIFRELVTAGRLVIEKVAGSHDRKFYPIRLPRRRKMFSRCSEDVPETRGTLYSTEPSTKETVNTSKPSAPAPVSASLKEADPEIVQQLVSLGVWPRTAAWLARTFPERIERAIAYFEAMKRARGKINEPGAYLKSCIVHNHGKGLDLAQVGKAAPPDPQRKRETVRAPREEVEPSPVLPILRAPQSPTIERRAVPVAAGADSPYAGMSPSERRAAMAEAKKREGEGVK